MKKRYVNLLLAMLSASAMMLASVPVMAKDDSAKTESSEDAKAEDEKETVMKILSEEMHHAASLKVELEIDMHDGKNWFEAK